MPTIRFVPFRVLALSSLLAVATGCSSDARDIKLSEMNQPEHASLLLEELSADERDLLGRYVAAHAVRRDLDYKLTVGEALQAAASEQAAEEEARVKAETARIAFMEDQKKQAAAVRDTRLNALLDQTMAQLPAQVRRQAMNELQQLMMMDADPNLPSFLPALTLLGQYLDSGLPPDEQTLREALELVRSDPDAMLVRLRDARIAADEKRRNDQYPDFVIVDAFLRRPDMRAAVQRIVPRDDFALLEDFLKDAQPGSPMRSLRISQALASARQGVANQ